MEIVVIKHKYFNCCIVLTLSRGLLSFLCCPASKESGGAQGAGSGHSQDSWPKGTRGMSHATWYANYIVIS